MLCIYIYMYMHRVLWGLGFGATILGALVQRIVFFWGVYWRGGGGALFGEMFN